MESHGARDGLLLRAGTDSLRTTESRFLRHCGSREAVLLCLNRWSEFGQRAHLHEGKVTVGTLNQTCGLRFYTSAVDSAALYLNPEQATQVQDLLRCSTEKFPVLAVLKYT